MFYILFIFTLNLFAKEAMVFDVRKTLAMSEDQKVYHDYYINLGSRDGIKPKMLLTVTRKDPFKDTNLSKIEEHLKVDVAVVEVIHVQQTFSIARLKNLIEGPVLEFYGVMIGDRIQSSSARMPSSEHSEASKSSQPKAVTKQSRKPEKVETKEVKKSDKQIHISIKEKIDHEPVKMSGEIPESSAIKK